MRYYYNRPRYNLTSISKAEINAEIKRNASRYAQCYDILKKAGCHVKISIFGHVYLDGVELTEDQIDDIINNTES